MASDFFLKLDGVKGDAMDPKHAGELQIRSFRWGETNSTSIGSATGGAGAGKVKFDEFVFRSIVNSASPHLAFLCASGTHIPTAVLTARKAGGDAQDYYIMTFKTVFITKYETSGVDEIPEQEITCVFGEYTMEYRPQKADGTLGAPILNGWNQITNKKA